MNFLKASFLPAPLHPHFMNLIFHFFYVVQVIPPLGACTTAAPPVHPNLHPSCTPFKPLKLKIFRVEVVQGWRSLRRCLIIFPCCLMGVKKLVEGTETLLPGWYPPQDLHHQAAPCTPDLHHIVPLPAYYRVMVTLCDIAKQDENPCWWKAPLHRYLIKRCRNLRNRWPLTTL